MISPIDKSLDCIEFNPKPKMEEQLEESRNLNSLLRFQALFGITYCGNTQFGKTHFFKLVFMCVYDLAIILGFIFTCYTAFRGDSFNRIFKNVSNKGVMNFVFIVSGSVILIEFLVIKTMLMIHGRQIRHTIQSIGYVSSKKQMYFIWIYMFVTSICNSLAITLNFVKIDQTFVQFYGEEKLKAILFMASGLVHAIVKSSILMLLLYSSFAIQRQLIGNAENFQMNLARKPTKLCPSLFELRGKIDGLNSLCGLIMFVKITSNAIQISGCICSIAVGQLDLTSTISLISFLAVSSADIIVSCRSSQLIINSMNNLCGVIENCLSVLKFSEEDYRQLQLILSMKCAFRYQVLDLFDLRDLTILSIIGLIANYSVILIQTQ